MYSNPYQIKKQEKIPEELLQFIEKLKVGVKNIYIYFLNHLFKDSTLEFVQFETLIKDCLKIMSEVAEFVEDYK